MNVDTAIQDMLFNWGDEWIRTTAELAKKDKPSCYYRYQKAYNWTKAQSDEFLDNICLAYELLVKNAP